MEFRAKDTYVNEYLILAAWVVGCLALSWLLALGYGRWQVADTAPVATAAGAAAAGTTAAGSVDPGSAPSPLDGRGTAESSPSGAGAPVLPEAPEPSSPGARLEEGSANPGSMLIPVKGVESEALIDSFADPRGKRRHEAIDIFASRGTPVLAATAGKVVKLFESQRGGISIYQFDPTGSFVLFYAHLDGYAAGLEEGDRVEAGQVLGFVGTTGNAPKDVPHLHFAVSRLGEKKRWWKGKPVNPYPFLLEGRLPS